MKKSGYRNKLFGNILPQDLEEIDMLPLVGLCSKETSARRLIVSIVRYFQEHYPNTWRAFRLEVLGIEPSFDLPVLQGITHLVDTGLIKQTNNLGEYEVTPLFPKQVYMMLQHEDSRWESFP